MKPVLFDVQPYLKNNIHVKEIRSQQLTDEFHVHNSFEMSLVIKGKGRRIVGDHVEDFQGEDLIFLGPNLPHVTHFERKQISEQSCNVHALVVYFQSDHLLKLLSSYQEISAVRSLLYALNQGIKIMGTTRSAVRRYVLRLRHADAFESHIILLRMLHLLSVSKDYMCLASRSYSNNVNAYNIRKLEEVYRYVAHHFNDVVSLERAADIANMTPTAFCKFFKQKTKKNFSAFVNETRVGHACKLLMIKDLDIAQVCYQSGFNNFTSFNKNFKTIMRMTPTEYRMRVIDDR